jgi:hypothetical protein
MKLLVVLSEYGYWGEELAGPLTRIDERGYDLVFATLNGARANALPPSLEPYPPISTWGRRPTR